MKSDHFESNYKYEWRNSIKAEIAFAKKENVFKARKWLKSGLIIQGMKMDGAEIYDFQLEKYL